MILYQSKEFNRAHLKRDSDILICINHDHVIFFLIRIEICTSVISHNINIFGKSKILMSKIRDTLIYLYSRYLCLRIIFHALSCKGSRSHSEDKDILRLIRGSFGSDSRHRRCGKSIIVIQSCQILSLHLQRLYSEHNICGKISGSVSIFNLQIVIY
ncbi:MAG: hypothetical protein BWY61_00676 [Firmicutes bacterium ADurb.Bin354]|nr:MAG: hypothetical protein BWY61_00676 [Firmicutes bacterium ADurb.Bin354]